MSNEDFFQALVLAAVASGLGASEAIAKAERIIDLLKK
jgi:hypothetical protein